MYEAFYGLDEKPFSVPPDPAYLYLSEKHEKALSRLKYSILNKAVFTVISGEIGSGKTTMVRELMHIIDEEEISVGLVSNVNFSSFEELLQWILYAFELKAAGTSKVELFETFTEFVIRNYSSNRRTVLIIDEAQNLDPGSLEQLRMLSNINVDQHQVLQLILIGQPSLLDMLKKPELEQFAQRIEVEYFLQPLSLEETGEYIKHRLKVAGGSEDLFTADTYPLIWQSTSGVPRLINILCGMALVYGFAEFKDRIDVDVVTAVLKDKEGSFSSFNSVNVIPEFGSNVQNLVAPERRSASPSKKTRTDADKDSNKGMSTIEKLFLSTKD